MNISFAKHPDFISWRITVKSVRANLLGDEIEVTSSRLVVINSARLFSVAGETATRTKQFPHSTNSIGLRFACSMEDIACPAVMMVLEN